ncbi:MAG: response regulator transcription factor [Gammaproteobacteria bacterium]|nr:response regulator transcription factor [Gammaproteobacteria bacterium]
MKILVADDHALIREALRYVLKELDDGVSVLEAQDGGSACRLVNEHPDLDLLLLDLKLPGTDGFATLAELRREHAALPVVILSGQEDATTMRAALDRGAMGFIPKSANNAVMLSALRLVLSGGRYVPPELLNAAPGTAAPTAPTSAPVSPADLGLTERQLDVLALMTQGKSNKQICRDLGLAEATVKIHVTAILRTLKVRSRTEAVVAINRLGLRFDTPAGAGGANPKHLPR